eukprot:CAMPEP_0177657320 /NCGR_PEP_ID=MMETSP0447-20121125/16116_1 /TAXON_ID=0 /ORGANISM="Stygamoeba regulata, Strain BSH-02190019" /LENGTH=342 /DNA_ID=CAMNT_0019161655 /DNA_START=26 /DNA_END=1054 /DNA_ORIENTATION=-
MATKNTDDGSASFVNDFDFGDEDTDLFGEVDVVFDLAPRWVEAHSQKAREKVYEPQFRDKASFVAGVLNIILATFVFSKYPEWYPTLHTIKLFTLIPLRWVLYKRDRNHYFLLDFCYFANVAVFLYLHFMPTNHTLFLICFAWANGPLLVAIPTWRNSLVFHSIDKITSLFIHISPALCLYCLRWFTPDSPIYNVCDNNSSSECSSDFFSLSVLPLAPYLVWQFLYFLKVEILSHEKVSARGYTTSLNYMLASGGMIGRWANKAKSRLGKVVIFMGLQFVYTMLTLLPMSLFFHNMLAHTIWLFSMLVWSIVQGANFYMEVFSARYLDQLEKRRQEANSKRK